MPARILGGRSATPDWRVYVPVNLFHVDWLFFDVFRMQLGSSPASPPPIIHETIMSLALYSTAPDNRFGVSL